MGACVGCAPSLLLFACCNRAAHPGQPGRCLRALRYGARPPRLRVLPKLHVAGGRTQVRMRLRPGGLCGRPWGPLLCVGQFVSPPPRLPVWARGPPRTGMLDWRMWCGVVWCGVVMVGAIAGRLAPVWRGCLCMPKLLRGRVSRSPHRVPAPPRMPRAKHRGCRVHRQCWWWWRVNPVSFCVASVCVCMAALPGMCCIQWACGPAP